MELWPTAYEAFREEERAAAHRVCELYADIATDPTDDPFEQARKKRAAMPAVFPKSDAASVEVINDVPCRVFRPGGPSRATYVDIHGGAMILGDATMGDVENERQSRHAGLTVISIDYRLAPEHPYPAASDDCLAVTQWALENTSERFLIGGSSAGAYLAAITILRVRDELGAADRFAGCLFAAGYFDHAGTPSALGARATDLPDVLDDSLIPEVSASYLPSHPYEKLRDPSVSPLYASLHGLPPALFSVGSADHLLDDSLFMAARWQAYGNDAELAVYPDATHGSMSMGTSLGKISQERRRSFIERVLEG
jgi:acetyl esterase/lipase